MYSFYIFFMAWMPYISTFYLLSLKNFKFIWFLTLTLDVFYRFFSKVLNFNSLSSQRIKVFITLLQTIFYEWNFFMEIFRFQIFLDFRMENLHLFWKSLQTISDVNKTSINISRNDLLKKYGRKKRSSYKHLY